MESYNTLFSPAEVLLPKFHQEKEKMQKWSVIACDQHTSEIDYWDTCSKLIGDDDSTYNYFMPEAYLSTSIEKIHQIKIENNMKSFNIKNMTVIDGLIYVERKLSNGETRKGLIGKIDLEKYEYTEGSQSQIRATEKTVIERIPPRCKIREEATIELPHILILTNDSNKIYEKAESLKNSMELLYDFDLMQGGGNIKGYAVCGNNLAIVMEEISAYENEHSDLTYAIGDGNHSLAAAKAHWNNIKNKTKDMSHPSRYALCEITSISDDSLVFEPIYRILKNCDINDVLASLEKECDVKGEQRITCISNSGYNELFFKLPTHSLTVGTLQNFIDNYIINHPDVSCDYIHGENTLIRLSLEKGCLGFMFDGMSKSELFPYVNKNGVLPRKTFSMGESDTKRYYLESRLITK